MASKNCKNNPNKFCYVCGKVVFGGGRFITDAVRLAYLRYFGLSIIDEDWVPHVSCDNCRKTLTSWAAGELVSLEFGIPRLWRKPSHDNADCYFCCTNIFGYNTLNKQCIQYADVFSISKPVKHSTELPIPVCPGLLKGQVLPI